MRIVHTGDWHIGKIVHGVHMTDDQRHMLHALVSIIENEKADVLVIAGDIYDRSIPPVEAVELLDEVLTRIVNDLGIKVIAIAGNHDSPDRLGFANRLFREKGLHIIGHYNGKVESIKISDAHGEVHFHPIPFIEPAVIKHLTGDESIRTQEDAMRNVLDSVKDSLLDGQRHFAIAHAFVTGGEPLETSESERPLSIGGYEQIDVSLFDGFDYVALGHLHGQQKVRHEHVRYSGSLMKYSFSEVKQKKSLTIIDLGPKGQVDIRQIQPVPLRDMRVIKGQLEQLIDPAIYKDADTNDYVMAVLTDEGELVEPMSKLRAVYPNILRMERAESQRIAGEEVTAASGDFSNKDPLNLFEEFYENVSGDTFSEDKKSLAVTILEDIKRCQREEE